MTYDQANRLLTTATTGSPNQPAVTLSYTYDKNGNRLTAVDPSDTNTSVYDVLNRLTSLTSPAGSLKFLRLRRPLTPHEPDLAEWHQHDLQL
jgi:YD repeat-containing protein